MTTTRTPLTADKATLGQIVYVKNGKAAYEIIAVAVNGEREGGPQVGVRKVGSATGTHNGWWLLSRYTIEA